MSSNTSVLSIYLFLTIVGAGLVLFAVLGSEHAGDHVGDGDLHAAHDAQGFHGADALSILLSMRFWSFFLAFGGVVGVVATLFGLGSPRVVAFVSVVTGLICGAASALAVRWLRDNELDSLIPPGAWAGKVGRVTVSCTRERPGKVVVDFGDRVEEVVALSSDGEHVVGSQVLVAEMTPAGSVRVKRMS